MPNTNVRAAAEGMPAINRRRLLNLTGAGLALAATAAGIRQATAIPTPIDTPSPARAKMSPELRAAIKGHKEAWAYWDGVCNCTDRAKLGREATAEEHQKWQDACDGEYSALWHVCRFPARTTADLAAKGRYLKKYHSWYMGELDGKQVRALLLSMSLVGDA